MILAIVFLALVFNILNGFHDSSNVVATIIFSRAMQPRLALLLTAAAEFAGPFLFGVAVAQTIGSGLVDPTLVTPTILLAALASAILWNTITWLLGIPSSSSHGLMGGLSGAILVSLGWHVLQWPGLIKVLAGLFLVPILGLIFGFGVARFVNWMSRNATLRINWFFKNAQIITGLGLALSHGANDAQKTMGVIALGLVATGVSQTFSIPAWVILVSGAAMALGTGIGGWSLIKTLGARFYKIRPVHGFCSQVASMILVLSSGLLGSPVSTTQVVSTSIMGVGAAERMSKVRWNVAGQIILTWVITIPSTAVMAAGFYYLLHAILY